jgi:hypothetical protein
MSLEENASAAPAASDAPTESGRGIHTSTPKVYLDEAEFYVSSEADVRELMHIHHAKTLSDHTRIYLGAGEFYVFSDQMEGLARCHEYA